jgi:ElaB/YqjD/DUF883 family membrane-anchored ribosome-binding protein
VERTHKERAESVETTVGGQNRGAIMIARRAPPVADETLSAHNARELLAEVERSRESAARLLDTFAQRVGGSRAVRTAASGVQRAAHYVQAHSAKDVAIGIERAVRSRPVSAMAIAVVAGFLAGRALRSR